MTIRMNIYVISTALVLALSACGSDMGSSSAVSAKAKQRIEALHKAFTHGDQYEVADNVCYPVAISVNGKQKTVKNKLVFLKYYGQVFDAKFKEKLKTISWTPESVGTKGITIGNGEIWFNSKGCTTTFNNQAG